MSSGFFAFRANENNRASIMRYGPDDPNSGLMRFSEGKKLGGGTREDAMFTRYRSTVDAHLELVDRISRREVEMKKLKIKGKGLSA